MSARPEPWLRGPIPGIPAPLQPAAHAFVMAREEVRATVEGVSEDDVWARPGGIASIGFHVAHLAGATDRLLTYARGESLNDQQRDALKAESTLADRRPSAAMLVDQWEAAVDRALAQLGATPPASLDEAREVGRAKLPSTVLGLIFHAAEHAARHSGQIVTTARLLRGLR